MPRSNTQYFIALSLVFLMGLSFFFLFHISFSQADEISGYAVPSQIGGWYSGGGSSHDQGGGGDTVPSDPVLNCPSSATVGTSVSVTATSDYGVTFEYYWDDNALNPVYTGSTNGSVTDTRTFDSPGNRTFSTAASNGSYSSNWVSCSFPVDQPPQPPQPAPSVALTASPGTVTVGDTADLSWTSMNSTSCSASSNPGGVWSGGKGLSGNETSGALSSDTTFNITCSTSDGQQASASASVNAVAPTCGDPYATNYGGPLPCTYPPPTCQDSSATNYGGSLPCVYPPSAKCDDPSATNYGGPLPCTYPPGTRCEDSSATNYGGPLPCTYPPGT
ncbi:MAG: hypothetical protein ABSF56_00005, partial [Minisyncoccia bacterium]